MNCERTRSDLLSSELAPGDAALEHLATCERCAEFARRLDTARGLFRDHQADHQPDGHFATRVSASVPKDSDLLGWAAMRLLPATLALLLALTAWAWLSTPGPGALVETSPTDDLLSWAIDEEAGS